MEELMIKIENVSKQYKLGQIGGTTLRDELQRRRAKRRGEEDPTSKIGARKYESGETFMALDGVSFEVKKGERVGIIGHNGAGKSTLLKLISRVTAPTAGSIKLNGRVASMLEVGTGFHPELTGRENTYMNGAILGMTRKEIDAKIEDIIEFSECRQFIDTPVKRYSSGMYVKLAFSVAVHLDSEIMIMDEVLAVGDMAFQKKCLEKMSDVSKSQGRTILYVSHNMNTIRQLCDRVIVLDHGKVVFDGDVEESIGVYMNVNSGEMAQKYYVEDIERTPANYGTKIRIHLFEFLDKQIPRYNNSELMKFRIIWERMTCIDNLRIRMEIYNSEGFIVGMTESEAIEQNIMERVNQASFAFSPKNLAADKYFFRLSFFTLGESGIHEGLDDIKKIVFEIEVTDKNKTTWNKHYWGNVRFDDIFPIKGEYKCEN